MEVLFLLGIFAVLGFAFGWLRWGTHFVVLGSVILWVWTYFAKGGDLYGDGDVSAAYWAILAAISAVGALLGGVMARSIRLSFRERRASSD